MFKFELEPILSLKEKLEESKKREFGMVQLKKEQIQSQKQGLENRYNELCMTMRGHVTDMVNVAEMKRTRGYQKYLGKQLEYKEEELMVVVTAVEEKRSELLEAIKQRKILDNLKEIKYEGYLDEINKVEQQTVDELVSYKYSTVKRSEH